MLVLNGDILTDVDFAAAVAHHESQGADGTIVLTRVADTSSYGVCVRDGTRITDFVEKPAPGTLPGQDAINAGTYVLEPGALTPFEIGPLSFERDVFPGIVARGGHLEGFVWDGVWADLGTPRRYREGTGLVLSGTMAWPTVDAIPDAGHGVRVQPGAHVSAEATVHGPVLVLDGARIEADATIGPATVVGRGALVGAGADVAGSVLFDRARIGDGVAVTGLLAGCDSVVERGAVLGRDVVLGDAERVGSGVVVEAGARLPPRGR
jgi:NDP-sugar pyrophosphorylase family protein